MLGAILGVGIPVICLLIAALTWRIFKNWTHKQDFDSDTRSIVSGFAAVLWPISLPLLGGYCLFDILSSDGRKKRATRKHAKKLKAEQRVTELSVELARRQRLVAEQALQQTIAEESQFKILGLPTIPRAS